VSDFQLRAPVAFIIFNRPDSTARVFAAIAKARPPKLLVVADGPRADRVGEAARCAAARALVERVDWDCEVLTNYSDVNLGCRRRVSSGIDWVFTQVPEAIILEDDCLPHPTFFRFCDELLERYREDERVAMIGGSNFQFGRRRTDASYYFSRYTHIWGWASWRRAWRHYDVDTEMWPAFAAESWLDAILVDAAERRYWARVFAAVHRGNIDTWDYQWVLSCWAQGMVSIIPEVNLISNIGFGAAATHTRGTSVYADIPASAMEFPLRHPGIVLPHRAADAFTAKGMFSSSLAKRVWLKLRAHFG